MNSTPKQFSRRTFLLSGAALGASWVSVKTNTAPLRVNVVGWGRHGRRFKAAVHAHQLSIGSVFDTRPARVHLAAKELRSFQSSAPDQHFSLPSFLRASDGSPVLLCSPPATWPSLLASLHSTGAPILVLAHHTDSFDPASQIDVQRVIDHCGDNLFLLGLDPAWPCVSLESFFDFARSRGAIRNLALVEHADWSAPHLAALHFDFLNCATSRADTSSNIGANSLRSFSRLSPLRSTSASSANCRFLADGNGLKIEAQLEIRADYACSIDHAFSEPQEGIEAFRTFASNSPQQRHAANQRRRILWQQAVASASAL